MTDQPETFHACPPDGSGRTPCCGRTPFELPRGDRISSETVTCTGPTNPRDLYAAAIALYDHAVGQATDPAPRDHHYGQADAVLAVRDQELEQLRAQVARVQELCANYERWQSEGWHPQQVTPGQAAREFRAALNPKEQP